MNEEWNMVLDKRKDIAGYCVCWSGSFWGWYTKMTVLLRKPSLVVEKQQIIHRGILLGM